MSESNDQDAADRARYDAWVRAGRPRDATGKPVDVPVTAAEPTDDVREALMKWLSAKVGGMCFEEAPWQEWGDEADELLALPAVRAALDAQETVRRVEALVRDADRFPEGHVLNRVSADNLRYVLDGDQ